LFVVVGCSQGFSGMNIINNISGMNIINNTGAKSRKKQVRNVSLN